MSLGALISIAGVYEVFTLGLARLSYAMATDGLLPGVFARLDTKSGAPYAGLVFQAACALVLALLFNVAILLTTAVFFLGICFAGTALAAFRLVSRHRNRAVRLPGLRVFLILAAVASAYLSAQASPLVIGLGLLVMSAGATAYLIRRTSWQRASQALLETRRGELTFERWLRQREAWLLHALRVRGLD